MTKRIDRIIGFAAALSVAVAPSFAGGDSGAAVQDLPWRDASGGISMPGAFSPETAQPQTRGMRADALSQDAQFWQLETIRDQLLAVTATPAADLYEQMLAERAKDPSVIGIGVDVPELNTVAATQASFVSFDAIDGGRLLALRIRAPGAVGMRLGLLVEQMPTQVSVAFADVAGNEPVAPPVTGAEITRIIETNQAAGDLSDEGRTYWSPMLEGEEALILIHVPHGVEADAVRFSIPRISYIFEDPLSNQSIELFQSKVAAQSAASCNLDATCSPDWNVESQAVAHMVYTVNGASRWCTGSLINDSDPSGFVPYFLTANHCISTQTAASTLQTHWYLQSAACNSYVLDPRYTIVNGGARLLYASAAMDTALLRLNQSPPGGVYYLGWSTANPLLFDDVVGIHHPQGDRKKISAGEFVGFGDCWSTTGSGFQCSPASSTTGNYLNIDWYAGTTEGGSSGSALLNASGQVIGTLWGGNGLCAPYGNSNYGRFSAAYADGLKDWLNPPPPGTYTSTPGGHVNTAASAGGVVVAATLNADNDVVVFIDEDGHSGWGAKVLTKDIPGPSPSGMPVTFVDPKDGVISVAYPSTSGLMLYRRAADGSWTLSNLTGAGQSPISKQLAWFISPPAGGAYGVPAGEADLISLVGLNPADEVVKYAQRRSGGGVTWEFANLTTRDFAPNGQLPPGWVGEPVGYTTPWNGQNVAGLNAFGEVVVAWGEPRSRWSVSNLSDFTPTPPLSGGLSAYVNWGINLTGILADGSLGVTWWSAEYEQAQRARGSEQNWAFTNLTAVAEGLRPRLGGDAVVGFTTPNWISNNIYGIAQDSGHLVAYWWAPGQPWNSADLNERLTGSEVPTGKLTAVAARDNSISVFGVNAEGEVLRFFWVPDQWRFENVSRQVAR